MQQKINVISMSGGKDSTATALLAMERESQETLRFVFADTGHEHQATYDYIEYLEDALKITIHKVIANFDAEIAHKREVVQTKWRDEGLPESTIERALELLVPSGNPFLDLCLWKGRFPSTRRRFCSEELKHKPLDEWIEGFNDGYVDVWSWQGIRADESHSRSMMIESEWHPTKDWLLWYRPILKWTAEDTFEMAKKHGIESNPLYKEGMGRVGCMPCIHATKPETFEIAMRFPEELERLAEWERLVSGAAKRGASTFFDARVVQKHLGLPKITSENVDQVSPESHGVAQYVEWAKTARGGRQYDLIKAIEIEENEQLEVPMCKSYYGLCE